MSTAQMALKKPIDVPRPRVKTRYIAKDKWAAVEKARGAVPVGEAVAAMSTNARVVRKAPPPAAAPPATGEAPP